MPSVEQPAKAEPPFGLDEATVPALPADVPAAALPPRTVREFEQLLKRSGYTNRQARLLIQKGWQGLADAESEKFDSLELDQLIESIQELRKGLSREYEQGN